MSQRTSFLFINSGRNRRAWLKRGAGWLLFRGSELAVFTGMALLQAVLWMKSLARVGRFQRRIHGMPEMGIRAERE
jgi:hypothetical protein